MDKEPSHRLKQAITKYRRAGIAVDNARDEAYAAILADLADGVRQTDIVRATGLTRERIRQIVIADRKKRAATTQEKSA